MYALRDASYELRVTRCELRVTGCKCRLLFVLVLVLVSRQSVFSRTMEEDEYDDEGG